MRDRVRRTLWVLENTERVSIREKQSAHMPCGCTTCAHPNAHANSRHPNRLALQLIRDD